MRNSKTRSPAANMELSHRSSLKTPEKSPRGVDRASEKVKVIIRIRPTLKYEEKQHLVELEDDNTLRIVRPGYDHMHMKFNHIVAGAASQLTMFGLVTDSINSFLKGINNTVFAYGQTGAGKTYTITGDCPENISSVETSVIRHKLLNESTRGILPRALEMIFTEVKKRREPEPRILLSFFYIYNYKIYDLYNLTGNPLDIREGRNGEVSIPDIQVVEVTEFAEALTFLAHGLKNRVTKATNINSKSSRSHSIFQLTYERNGRMKVGDKPTEFRVVSSIRIVDLAGSEKFKIPTGLSASEQDLRVQEVTCINGSLSSLGHCISALIERTRTHIPFRNSKLTRILSDSLTGNGQLKLVVCISPSVSAAAETFSTLQFANRAKKAIVDRPSTPKPSADRVKTVEMEYFNALLREYEKEKKQRIELYSLLASSENGELIERNKQLERQNEELRAQLRVFTNSYLHGGHASHTPKDLLHRFGNKTDLAHTGNFGRKTVQPSKVDRNSKVNKTVQEFDGKSFLSLSVLKEDRSRTPTHLDTSMRPSKDATSRLLVSSKQIQHAISSQSPTANKRRVFENKYKKFMDFKSPEKRESAAEEGKRGSRSISPYSQYIRNQLDKIRKRWRYSGKAIKSKEQWFELDNHSDELNDTRYFFVNQTDDEDLFQNGFRGTGSLEESFGRGTLEYQYLN